MASNAAQLGVLLWKNWLLWKRRVGGAATLIVLPILCSFLVTQIRWKIDATFVRAPTIWDSFNASPSFPSNLAFPAHEDVSTPNVTGNVTEMSTSFPPKWVLVFAPSTSKVATRMSRGIARMLDAVPMDVESEEEVENFFVNQTASIRAHGAVVFDEASFDGDRVRRDAAVLLFSLPFSTVVVPCCRLIYSCRLCLHSESHLFCYHIGFFS